MVEEPDLEALENLEKELEGDIKPLEVDEEEGKAEDIASEERTVEEKEVDEEEDVDDVEEEEPTKGFIATYWLLIVGVMLGLSGMVGMILLRFNIIQVYLLGDTEPFPGIGRAEPMGHVGGSIMLVIGVLLIFYWGLKTKEPEREEDSEPVQV